MPEFHPIATFHSSYETKADAPRQGVLQGELGFVEFRKDLDVNCWRDLNGFDRVWLIYQFHQAQGWSPTVNPPRGGKQRRGVFATRSPYRPNPLGLSCVRLLEVQSRGLVVQGHDLLDQTPILDIKPYLAYADAFPEASLGWIGELKIFRLSYTEKAQHQLQWLRQRLGDGFVQRVEQVLQYSPEGGPAHRIKPGETQGHFVLAVKTWRCLYQVKEGMVLVEEFKSGYPTSHLETKDDQHGDKSIHQQFQNWVW